MIDLYAWDTPECRQVAILLEDAEFDYAIKLLDPEAHSQARPLILASSPAGRLPAIVDHDASGGPLTIIGSRAILQHLGEQRPRLFPASSQQRACILHWLDWQADELAPALASAPTSLADQTARLFGVLDRRLGEIEHVGGDDFSIADIAIYPFANQALKTATDNARAGWVHALRWHARMSLKPTIGRGMAAIGSV